VRLRFDARVAQLVRARVWHPSQAIVGLPDGGVELRMRTNGPELVRQVLEFGDKVEVVEPQWLRDAVVDELAGALERYGLSVAARRATGS
jgi:predicted DNA-binding transcriptional regulator YafY